MDFQTRDDIALARSLLSPPGDTLGELLVDSGVSQSELASRMGRPLKTINEIVNAKAAITADTAVQLEKTLGVKATFWLERERNFRLELAALAEAEKTLDEISALDWFPHTEMKRVGWITPSFDSPVSRLDAVLRFFAVASVKAFSNSILGKNRFAVSFRRDLHRSASDVAMAAWLRHGEREAETLKLPVFDKKAFEAALFDIRELAMTQPDDFQKRLIDRTAAAGVAVVFSQNLKGAPVSGAARWIRNTPLIQLSGRYKTNDRFWFTFFHEAGHLLLHDKKEAFLDEAEGFDTDAQKEADADRFAADFLISPEKWIEIRNHSTFREADVRMLSAKNGLHPGIVVGRLQKEGILQFSQLNGLKEKIALFD